MCCKTGCISPSVRGSLYLCPKCAFYGVVSIAAGNAGECILLGHGQGHMPEAVDMQCGRLEAQVMNMCLMILSRHGNVSAMNKT